MLPRAGGGLRSPARRGASPKLFEQGGPPAPTRAAPGGTHARGLAGRAARHEVLWLCLRFCCF
ncbi:hypothetical protein C3489_14795 [Streptomyces sp. Ru71]|nr:hypothetical protein C3489_14795 [Streptomyces sp. Ru71]